MLKTDQQRRVGPYKAFYKRSTLIADGYYTNGQKSGVWKFFDWDGKPTETYDYDKIEFTFEAPIDTTDDISYGFDITLNPTDRLTRPLRIGGSFYGFIPYVSVFKLPFDTAGINTNYFNAMIELLISPGGRLADYKVHLFSKAYQYKQTFNFDVNLFAADDKIFVPATLNRQPILSRIFIRCSIDDDGSLDFY